MAGKLKMLLSRGRKRGARYGTSNAQRNASRRNIRKAIITKKARTIKY